MHIQAPQNQDLTARKFLGIEMLRGVAVIFTVFAHYPLTTAPFYWINVRAPWFIGVPIFYGISGWIIAHVTRNDTGRNAAAFLTKRFFRLAPVLIFTSAVALLFSDALPHTVDVAPIVDQFYPTPDQMLRAISVNLLFLSDVSAMRVGSPYSMLGLWSISVEAKFYLVYASIMFLPFVSRSVAIGGIAILIFLFRIALIYRYHSEYAYTHVFYVELFAAGMISYGYRSSFSYNKWAVVGAFAYILIFACFQLRGAIFLIGYILLIGSVVYIVNCASNIEFTLDSWIKRTLLWVGRRSYTIYVLHFQLFAIAGLFAQLLGIVTGYNLALAVGFFLGLPVVDWVFRTLETKGNRLGHSIAMSITT